MNFQFVVPSISIDNVKQHCVLGFDLTSMQDATEGCNNPEKVGEPLRLEFKLAFPLEHITEPIVFWKHLCSVAVDNFGVFGNVFQNGQRCFPAQN